MPKYIDGFVIALPKKNLEKYRVMAKKFAKVALEAGAVSVCENIAEDVKVGKLTSFPQAVKLKQGEVVIFSWIEFKSRASRDKVNKKIMEDPRMIAMMDPANMIFDGKRMIYGGFEVLMRA